MFDPGFGAFTAINTCFLFADFAAKLTDVGSENEVFVRTIHIVKSNLEEIERLVRLPSILSMYSLVPAQAEFAKTALYRTKVALNDIGLFVERVRSDKDRNDSISFSHRVRWVLKDHGKLQNRRAELAACHQTLSTIMNTLHSVEISSNIAAAVPNTLAIPPPIYTASGDDDFMSPNQMRRRKSKIGSVDIKVVELKNNEEDATIKAPTFSTFAHLGSSDEVEERNSANSSYPACHPSPPPVNDYPAIVPGQGYPVTQWQSPSTQPSQSQEHTSSRNATAGGVASLTRQEPSDGWSSNQQWGGYHPQSPMIPFPTFAPSFQQPTITGHTNQPTFHAPRAPSPTPSFASSTFDVVPNPSWTGQHNQSPDINLNRASHSRKRRAMMEAAIGDGNG